MARETTPAFHCRWTPARGKMSRSSGRGGSRRVLQTRQRLSLISAVEGGARQDVAFWFPSRKSACVRWRLPALTSLLYVTLLLKCFTFQQLWFQWFSWHFPTVLHSQTPVLLPPALSLTSFAIHPSSLFSDILNEVLRPGSPTPWLIALFFWPESAAARGFAGCAFKSANNWLENQWATT